MSYVENSQKKFTSQIFHKYIKSFKKGKASKMKDLSKEERTKQHILKLEERISDMLEEGRKHKWLRIRITFYILSIVIFFIVIDGDIINSTLELLSWFFFAPLIAIGVMAISYVILAYTINGVIKDAFAIGQMVGRKDAVELSELNEVKQNEKD